ncbi:TonB-dependent receptor [Luminiphilus sp.]|nr:TonB-dependent receptor [Luminiphilus sp.]MDA9710914.1 TonB-dependent receptor [Luminiphilus sp.]
MKNLRCRAAVLSLCSVSVTSGTWAQEAPIFEEVLVTAEKRTESLQNLSQAVTALSAEDAENRQLSSFVDLSAIAPGVNVAKNEGFKTVITIRGIGNEANQNAIANPSVSYHLDGVYVASPFALQTDFLDLERIEVLRGPQGTLFGQNSTGGGINVITKAPTFDDFYGTADLTVGEYSLVKARAAMNIPMSDTLAARVSLMSHKHDGYTDNVGNGQDLDDADSISARAKILFQPSDNFSATLTAQVFDEDVNGQAQKGIYDPTPGARSLAQDSLSSYELESQLYSMTLEWDFGGVTLKSLTSYQNDEIAIQRDNDRHDFRTLPPFFLLQSYFDPETNEQTTTTQEFNLISNEPAFGKLDWVAGIFYLDTEVDILIRERLDFNFDGAFDPIVVQEVLFYGGEVGFISDSKPERESMSIYGQGTWSLTDSARIVAGLRYTEDEVYSSVTNFFGRGGTDILEIESEKVTGRLAFEMDLSDASMAYASYTRGFKPGGSNLTFGREDVIAPIVVLPVFEEETIDAYEVGLKTDLAEGRVRLNGAMFFYQYDNLQYQATDPELFQGGVGNVPESEIYGAEIELGAFLTDSLVFDARIALLETEITASHLALDNVAGEARMNALLAQGFSQFGPEIQIARAEEIADVEGNELPKTPSFTANLALTYSSAIGSWGNFEGSLSYTHRGDFRHRIFNNPTTDEVDSYDTIDLVLRFSPANANWRVELIGKNLTDEDGINARFTDVFGVGATGDQFIPPRVLMARVGIDF